MTQLTTKTKMTYGLGLSAQGIKDGLFQLFLFFYFSQVLGLDAALAGAASVIALMFDAVSDPLVGLLSDKWESRNWGRRHPFMFFSAVPLGIFTWLLFLPPADLGQTGLFIWLTTFSVLVRVALTFFIVPHMSLGAELTTDYKERTSVTSYRIMFAAFVMPVILIFGLTTFFAPTEEYSYGLFNKEAYPRFAFFCGVLMILTILLSTYGTKHVIPNLPQVSKNQEKMTTSQLFQSLMEAFKMRSYSTLIGFTMLTYVGLGIGIIFTTYFTTYYFELTETELAALPIGSAVGGVLALFIAPAIGEKLDKKWGTMLSAILFGVFFTLPFNLRILGMFPENGTPALMPTYIFFLVFAYLFLWVALSLANSMMADVVDEYELKSGTRQEGLFFSTMSFAYKMTTGLGSFIAGLLLNWIAFPKQAEKGEVPQAAIDGLGIIGGPILLAFYLSSIIFIFFYPITKKRYFEIRGALNKELREVK